MYYDILTRIKNAQAAGHERFKAPFTNMDYSVLFILAKYGYISGVTKKGRGIKRVMETILSYKNGKPVVNGVKIVSRPGRRVYIGSKDIRPVKQGYGLGLISTSKGIMTTNEAYKQKIGGEYLFQIW